LKDSRRNAGATIWSLAGAGAIEAPVKILLETGCVDIELEHLSCEGMLGGQVFGAPDALLPACVGHRAIMGLPASASNCSVLEGYSVKYSSSRH
jgi:hypothetical protein